MNRQQIESVDTAETTGFIPLFAPEIRAKEWEYVGERLDANSMSAAASQVAVVSVI